MSVTTPQKRKLLFELYPDVSIDQMRYNTIISQEKINKFKHDMVKTIFIISSNTVYRDSYLQLVKQYEDLGYKVKSIHIEELDKYHLQYVRNAVKDIDDSFKEGSCGVVSFGKSYAGTIISSFFVYSGDSVEDAINRVQNINQDLIGTEEEKFFINEFRDFVVTDRFKGGNEQHLKQNEIKINLKDQLVKGIKDAVLKDLDIKEIGIKKDRGDFAVNDEIRSKKPHSLEPLYDIDEKESQINSKRSEDEITKKHKAPPVEEVLPLEPEAKDSESFKESKGDKIESKTPSEKRSIDLEKIDESKFGNFFSSIRFKLISIISFILALSISGMIFLASHFFKNDNQIRVQENNHKISEVISLKIKSDFQSIINKSRLIANALIQRKVQGGVEYFSRFTLSNDRDIIFQGVAVPSKKSNLLRFVRYIYNFPLMNESQITKEDIFTVNKTNRKVFSRSFDGEVVVHNISPGLKNPVIGISFPFNTDYQTKDNRLVLVYVKLDRFLRAFKSNGDITKVFMVNEDGDIIAHQDSSIVISGGNYINLPIVKMMIKSKLDNGQTRYEDENSIPHLGSFKKLGIGGTGIIATVDENRAFQAVYDIQRRNIYLMIIILTIAILIVFVFGNSITTPLIRLLGATKRIKEGDYRVNIHPATKDEIGELTNAFIEMGKGLEEREKIKSAFGKFVNPDIAEQLMRDDVHLGGETKIVTILFSDIRSFTAISERLEPSDVVEFLNDYLSRMVDCVHKSSGIVDKFIGDAIMAVWGVPMSKGNDAENAISGALMMRKALNEFNIGRGDEKKPKINIGCGISTGSVLVGQIGSENRMEYTVIGDPVNLASRIEELNKPFGTDILISEETYNQVKEIFAVEEMDPINVKGKEKTQHIYSVLGRLDDPETPKSVEELQGILGIERKPLQRRWDDKLDKEVKYEILER